MKTTNSRLLDVVMDDIKDAGMMFEYAEQAKAEGNEALRDWFKQKASERHKMAESEWNDAMRVLDLEKRDDDASMCLKRHVDKELSMLKASATK